MKKIMIVSMLLTGCTHTVIDRDFDKEEAQFIKEHGEKAAKDPNFSPATPDNVVVAEEHDVKVSIHKVRPTIRNKLELQNWSAVITNNNEESKCAAVMWKLMDFELETNYPDFLYLQPKQQVVNYAKMKQVLWNIEGTEFALPPSGYVKEMLVVDPNKDAKKGEECVFESEIIDPPLK
jgi:hypothetical protein